MKTDGIETLEQLLRRGEAILTDAGIENGKQDAWFLMEYVMKIERSYFFLHREEPVEERKTAGYLELIEKRKHHVPLQQLTGEAWFMGLPFYVNENVLIPRQDTESLAEFILKLDMKPRRILDLCTGSGCILLSLLYLWEQQGIKIEGVGADISPEAIKTARFNSRQLGLEVSFVESDLFQEIAGTFDVIVSNPPYIASGVIPELMEEVKDFEPHLALDGGADGLNFYREITAKATAFLNPGGWLCLEIGYDQGEALQQMLKSIGYQQVQIIKDLAGQDRIAAGRWNR